MTGPEGMIVWLWGAHGPKGRVRGVTTHRDKAHALRAAEEALRRAGAGEVLVEQAYTALELGTLRRCYQRTGERWHGRITHAGSPVTWEPPAHERTAARA